MQICLAKRRVEQLGKYPRRQVQVRTLVNGREQGQFSHQEWRLTAKIVPWVHGHKNVIHTLTWAGYCVAPTLRCKSEAGVRLTLWIRCGRLDLPRELGWRFAVRLRQAAGRPEPARRAKWEACRAVNHFLSRVTFKVSFAPFSILPRQCSAVE